MKTITCALPIVLFTALTTACPVMAEIVEWDELKLIIEINATDGDVGFHALADAGAWRWFRIDDPDGNKILAMRATGSLRDQGMTENFFESAEPLCEPDEEEPDEPVVTFAEFIMRFPEGDYLFRANNNEGDRVKGTAELTYNLPAAPDISMTEDSEQPIDEVIIEWAQGTDLGEKCHDQSLVDDGIIADPASVEIVGWEVVVEPDDDEAADPHRKFSVQLPPDRVRLDPASAKIRGVEVTLEYRSAKEWNGWVSYTWSKATDSINGVNERRSWDQRHAFQAGLAWQRDLWEVGVALNVHSGWPITGLSLGFGNVTVRT